jgi:hypothetical protein
MATVPTAYATMSACMTAYAADSATKQQCQSYHLCWGVEGKGPAGGGVPKTHCPHAWGTGACM